MKNKVFQFGYAEPHPVLFKDNLIQEQKGTIFPIFFAVKLLILFKSI